jgi:NAD(P)-dependent dehydrogenase (short-subunit alcohol dehydrogenase family)
MGVNARGAFLTNQQACRRMKSGGGAIINFASSAGIRGMGDRAAYSAAKGAVLGWTRAAALAWGKYDITVNAIAPTMNTEVARRYLESVTPEERARMDAERVRTTPMQGRLGEVTTDLLPLVLLLCGPGGRYMTGQTFAVDGGRTMLGS